MNKIKIAVVVNQYRTACEWFRLIYPYQQIQKDFAEECEVKFVELSQLHEEPNLEAMDIFKESQVIVFHKNHVHPIIVEYLAVMEKVIIVDFDDIPTLPKSHPEYERFTKEQSEYKMLQSSFEATLVTCSTINLLSYFTQYKLTTVYIPNALPDNPDFKVEKIPHSLLHIGWMCNFTHLHDVSQITYLMHKLNDAIGEKNYNFFLFGYDSMPKHKEIFSEIINKITSNRKFSRNFNIRNMMPFPAYFSQYGLIDISIAPNKPGYIINEYKSNLKWLEATQAGIPCICSPTPAYDNVIDFENGFIAKNCNVFVDRIEYLYKYPKYATGIVENAKSEVEEYYNLKKTAKYLFDNIKKMIL